MSTPKTHKVTAPSASTVKKSAANKSADKAKPKNAVAAAKQTTAKSVAHGAERTVVLLREVVGL